MLFGHWFPPHDPSLAGCNSDIITVGYSFWLLLLNDSFLKDLDF